MSLSFSINAQENYNYPDSLKGIVLKIEPLSLLYSHISIGIEVPMSKAFLDVNVGASGIGLTNYLNRKGGFLTKVGIKFPLKLRSPFSIIYLMPEVAYSNYKMNDYSSTTFNSQLKTVNATAIMICFGYRHISPQSNFYYDGGIDLGYGWANLGGASNNYNFNISNNNGVYPQTSTTGVAVSCHLAIGFLIKPPSVR